MKEILRKAAERFDKNKCKVCPVCNGAVCGGLLPGMGGIGSGASFQNNIKALADKKLAMKVLHNANNPNCELEIFGRKISFPFMIAPIGDVTMNVGGHLTITQYTSIIIKACVELGTFASIGDLPKVEPFESAVNTIQGRGKNVIPFIKTWLDDEFMKKLEITAKAGCDICGSDVDSAGLPGLRNCPTPVTLWDGKKLSEMVKKVHSFGMKYIIKGIMSVKDAEIAAGAGADAIVVSNHGGRVLDYTPGSAEVLPSIAEAVGKDLIVMADGGVRTGADVLKMLALGAKLVLICRPAAIAAHGDEENGLQKYFTIIKNDLLHCMRMTNCSDLQSVNKNILC
ncbi:MAG: alpha-hydroxy-acid oxidizing protein [Elusimicrobiota bacterium]|jgi:isopentenyl diphosphate isomerase/L-lactate dehydrogenase-like FMN-dependent dehydrogenase|nr:alpha-hydroxy-acid oxidizing protein [Elusimicrobiota bacterium]